MSPWRRWILSVGIALFALLPATGSVGAGVLDATWTAPTTNTDGSALTDLGSYRVYYGTATSPCPGPSFSQVTSPTPSPGTGQTVSHRLTGLTTGTPYNVSVTAVDLSGNESACSTAANGVAAIDFAVSPTGTVSFGNVNIGSVANQTFTVSNTKGGTVSGTVSTSAPFSIVSGSPFTLVGLGATQTVTVRFTPTTATTASVNVNFAADGDSVSRLVTGTGVNGPDTTAPTVTITAPTANPTVTTSSASLNLGGTASDNVGVTQVTWANNRGGSGTATGTTNWAANGITIVSGQPNVITVTARDAAGNTSTDTLTVTLSGSFTFTDDPLTTQSTAVKAAHFTELRAAINTLRAARGLAAFTWTDPTLVPGGTGVRAVHLTELRTALNQAYQAAGRTLPTYTDPTVGVTIKAIHLNELRTAVRAL